MSLGRFPSLLRFSGSLGLHRPRYKCLWTLAPIGLQSSGRYLRIREVELLQSRERRKPLQGRVPDRGVGEVNIDQVAQRRQLRCCGVVDSLTVPYAEPFQLRQTLQSL